MISFEEAKILIAKKVKFYGSESVKIQHSLGRVLNQSIFATRNLPPFNRAMMDGIAINVKDLDQGITEFYLRETIFAGKSNTKFLNPGDCYKIMTGAAVPTDANVVIRNEDVLFSEETAVVMTNKYSLHQNISLKASNLKEKDVAIPAGIKINSATIGLLASLGQQEVKVNKLPKINLITTGDEIYDINETVSPYSIYNSNLYLLGSLLDNLGIKNFNHCHVIDNFELLTTTIQNQLNCDILILTGGVSAGDADYIPLAMQSLGADMLFHKVEIKPGKPIWCGMHSETLIFALPGNPYSCLVTFKLFVEYFIKKCSGGEEQLHTYPINFLRERKSDFDEFFPVKIREGRLDKVSIENSGDVRMGYEADSLAFHPKIKHYLQYGDLVTVLHL